MISQNQLLIIFGRQPDLGVAELMGFAASRGWRLNIEREAETAIVEGVPPGEEVNLCHQLGGVVKVVEIVAKQPAINCADENSLLQILSLALKKLAAGRRRFNFGFSLYGSGASALSLPASRRLGISLKRQAAHDFDHIRWVSGRRGPLSSVVVKSQLLGGKGLELIVLSSKQSCLIGRTIAVQEYSEWSERDYGRPRRNAKRGMLPPKLARMMINMLGLAPAGTLLDPFCGSGTILTEGALLGWQNLIASDIDPLAVADTEKNFSWQTKRGLPAGVNPVRNSRGVFRSPPELSRAVAHASERRGIISNGINLQTYQKSVAEIRKTLPRESVRAIVTEGYLGKPLLFSIHRDGLKRHIEGILPVYKEFFETAAALLELGGQAVFAVPVWTLNDGTRLELPWSEQPLPSYLRPSPITTDIKYQSLNMTYSRSGQKVGRRIVRLEKVTRLN